jgi:hypothetical protein
MMSTPLFKNKDKITTDRAHIVQEMKLLPNGKKFLSTQNFLRLTPTQLSYNAMWIGCPTLRPEQITSLHLETPLAVPVMLERSLS